MRGDFRRGGVLQDFAGSDIKCVAYMALKRGAQGKRRRKDTWHGVAAFLRGDHQVNETKLLGAIEAAELRTMQAEELEQYLQGTGRIPGTGGTARTMKSRWATA